MCASACDTSCSFVGSGVDSQIFYAWSYLFKELLPLVFSENLPN